MLIGDKIEQLLRAIGITDLRIKALTGKDCKCAKRKAALNRRHNDLKVWWRMRRSSFDAQRTAARRNMNTAKARVVMAWKCLRYGNPYFCKAKTISIANARKEDE